MVAVVLLLLVVVRMLVVMVGGGGGGVGCGGNGGLSGSGWGADMRKVEILLQTDFWGFEISQKWRDSQPNKLVSEVL